MITLLENCVYLKTKLEIIETMTGAHAWHVYSSKSDHYHYIEPCASFTAHNTTKDNNTTTLGHDFELCRLLVEYYCDKALGNFAIVLSLWLTK